MAETDFDPDKWWTWPIPKDFILTRNQDGTPKRCSPEGWAWVDGFEAGRNSLAEELLDRDKREAMGLRLL